MKKFIAIALCFAMSFCFFACNRVSTAAEYLALPEVQAEMSSLKTRIESDGTMKFDALTEGNKLIYTYTYTTELENIELVKETFEHEADRNSSAFVSAANILRDKTNITNPIVAIRYINADGSEIFSAEYHPDEN